jgi:DNA polymerase
MCRVNALPASLDDATRALDTNHRKNHRGGYLIRQLSIPDKNTGEFRESATLLKEMGDYCVDDVQATTELKQRLRPMSVIEQRDWLINERINDRGVKIDLELATLALQYAEDEKAEIADRLNELTGGAVTKHSQAARLAKFVHSSLQGYPLLQEQLFKSSDLGERKLSCDKAIRENLLASAELPEHTREVIQLAHDGGKSSVSKFERMLAMADPDTDRVHGVFVYAGAGQTKRYASRGLQLHNMARKCFKPDETEELKELMRQGTYP